MSRPKLDWREIPDRKPIYKQPHLPVKQALAKMVRPLRKLQKRKRSLPRPRHIFLDSRRR